MTLRTRDLSANPWDARGNIGLDTDIGEIGVLDAATVRRAQLAVCDRSADAAEAGLLLHMLGIGGGA